MAKNEAETGKGGDPRTTAFEQMYRASHPGGPYPSIETKPKPAAAGPGRSAPAPPRTGGGRILARVREKYEGIVRQAQADKDQREQIEQELLTLSRRPLEEVASALGISPETAKHLLDMARSLNKQP